MLLKRSLLEYLSIATCCSTVFCVILHHLTDISPLKGTWFNTYLVTLIIASFIISFKSIQWLLNLNRPLKYDFDYLQNEYPVLYLLFHFYPCLKNLKQPRKVNEYKEYDTNELSVITTVLEKRLVSSWYVSYISEEIGFPFACKQLLDQIIGKFFQISHNIEPKDLFLDVCLVLSNHLKEYRKTIIRHEKSPTIPIDALYKKSHPIYDTKKHYQSTEHCVNLLRIIFKELVPWELWDTPHSELLIRIQSKKLDNFIDSTLADPAWINDKIMTLICNKESQNTEVTNTNVETTEPHTKCEENITEEPKTETITAPKIETSIELALTDLVNKTTAPILKQDVTSLNENVMLESFTEGSVETHVEGVRSEPIEIIAPVMRKKRGRQRQVKVYDRVVEGNVKTWETELDLQCISLGQDLLATLDGEMTLSRLWGNDGEHSPPGQDEGTDGNEEWLVGEEDNKSTTDQPTNQPTTSTKSLNTSTNPSINSSPLHKQTNPIPIPSNTPVTLTPITTRKLTIPSMEQHYLSTQQHMPSTHQHVYVSSTQQHIPSTQQHIPSTQQHIPSTQQHIPSTQQHIPSTQQHIPSTQQQIPPTEQKPSTLSPELPEISSSPRRDVSPMLRELHSTVEVAKHKMSDLQVDPSLSHNSDEATGMMEGLLDFGMAGIRKGLKFTGLGDDIPERPYTPPPKERSTDKPSPPLEKSTDTSVVNGNTFSSGDSNGIKDDTSSNHQLTKQQRVTSQDSMGLSLLRSDSPEPEYEEAADLSSSIAKLRALLQKASDQGQDSSEEGEWWCNAEEITGRSSHRSHRNVDTAALADEYDMNADRISEESNTSTNNMQRLDRLFQRTVTGVFNSLRSAVGGETHSPGLTPWEYLTDHHTHAEVYSAVGRLVGSKRAGRTDSGVDPLSLTPHIVAATLLPTDDYDEWCGSIYSSWTGVSGVAGGTHSAHVLATNLLADLMEPLLTLWLDELTAWLKVEIFATFTRMADSRDEPTPVKREVNVSDTCDAIMEVLPAPVQIFGEDTIRSYVNLFVSSLSHKQINKDILFTIIDLFAVQFQRANATSMESFGSN